MQDKKWELMNCTYLQQY